MMKDVLGLIAVVFNGEQDDSAQFYRAVFESMFSER